MQDQNKFVTQENLEEDINLSGINQKQDVNRKRPNSPKMQINKKQNPEVQINKKQKNNLSGNNSQISPLVNTKTKNPTNAFATSIESEKSRSRTLLRGSTNQTPKNQDRSGSQSPAVKKTVVPEHQNKPKSSRSTSIDSEKKG